MTSALKLRDVIQEQTNVWIKEYNQERPHESLRDLTPEKFVLTRKPEIYSSVVLNSGHLHYDKRRIESPAGETNGIVTERDHFLSSPHPLPVGFGVSLQPHTAALARHSKADTHVLTELNISCANNSN